MAIQLQGVIMSLPVPTDPNFRVDVSEEEFFRVGGPEDEALLKSGAFTFDDDEEDERDELLGEALQEVRALRKDVAKK